ncbi:MAG: hypothetical protein ACRETN_00515 [Nevskiales bacterium]
MDNVVKRSKRLESAVHWLLLAYVLTCVFVGADEPDPIATMLGYLLLPLFVILILAGLGKLLPRQK